ncbi:hypothetical protein MNBD_GAMMA07-2484 [hydrothermal vent metagenome]|uniref:Uncharacterized protein n=1 Tax=hydrothermal vent metagenome TaxID=652676 RepID=A0A3B0WL88_9ZZZZ
MIKTITLWGALSLSLFAQNVFSSDKDGHYWIYGVGRQTCETYLEARDTGDYSEISYKNWISGYVTASNRSLENTYTLLGETDFQGALDWIDSYCEKNVKNSIYMAVENMRAVYYRNRKKAR